MTYDRRVKKSRKVDKCEKLCYIMVSGYFGVLQEMKKKIDIINNLHHYEAFGFYCGFTNDSKSVINRVNRRIIK